MERSHILSLIRMGNTKKTPLFKKKKREELRTRWQDIEKQRASHMEELVQTFKRECELLTGKVYIAQTNDESSKFLSAIIQKAGINRIIKWDTPLLRQLEIDNLFNSLGVQNMLLAEKEPLNEADQKDCLRPLSTAELGISGADYGLADTGTLVLRTLPTQDRVTSLLPPIHVAIMESKHILPSSEDLIARLMVDLEETPDLDSCITLITGPSLTADIELNLVLGIHGPRELHVIILESN